MKQMEMSAASSDGLKQLHDHLCPYLQEIISAKLKPHILHLSQYSQNPSIKQNWLSRYPILSFESIFYKKSKIHTGSAGGEELSEKQCVIYTENLTFNECLTKKTLCEIRELRKAVRIKGPVVILKESYECSLDELQELFELTEAQGLTLYGPYMNNEILSLPAVSKMRKLFLSGINLNNSYLNKLCHVEHMHIGGDELEFKDITNLIRLLRYKENLRSFRISFSRRRLSLKDRRDILGDEAAGFVFPFMVFEGNTQILSLKALSLYRNYQIMFVVDRQFNNNNMLIKFEEKEIFLISQAYASNLIHGFKNHGL